MADSPITQAPPEGQNVYGIFAGNIDQLAVGRISNAAAIASSNRVSHFHLLIQSLGGTIGDGIALYNIFRTFPIPLTLYNVGTIASAAVLSYLGAPHRITSRLATFMIHRTTSPPIQMTSDRLQAVLHSVDLDDKRTERNYFFLALFERVFLFLFPTLISE